jgi:ATP-dependent Clp protease, protease subunit
MNRANILEEFLSTLTFEKLMKSRVITIFGEINQHVAQQVTEKLLLLADESAEPIKVIINSQGGHVEAGDTIFDMIQFVEPRVRVLGTGWVASAGALIFSAPPVDRRFSLPNTRFLLHQPSGGIMGAATDVQIEAKEIIKMRQRLNEIIARQTGQPLEKVKKDTDRNYWMSAQEAQDYHLVGNVIQTMDQFML